MGASVVDKNSPFTTPTKPSSKLTSSVEAKENRLTSPNFGNQMKSSTKKNFMSPTISAASKTVAQRKKILVERNGVEAAEPTCAKFHRRRSSSFDLKQGSVDLGASMDSLSSSINDITSVGDGEVEDAKMKPYDPVINYCSPRPKFLLYKPDRRSEILRRYEMIDSTSSESETGSEQEECLAKQNVHVTEETNEFANHTVEVVAHLDKDAGESVEEFSDKKEAFVEEFEKKSEDHNEVNESIKNHHEEIKEEHKQEAETVKDPNITKQPEEDQSRSTDPDNETTEIKSEALQTKENDEIRIQSVEVEDEDEEVGEFEEGEVERCFSFKRLLKFWLVLFVLGLSILYLSSMNSGTVGLNGDDWKAYSDIQRAPFIHENASGAAIQNELAIMGFEEASHRVRNEINIREPDNDIGEFTRGVEEVDNEGGHVTDLDEVVDAKLIGISTSDQVEAVEDEIDLSSKDDLTEVIHQVDEAGNAGDIVGEELACLKETTAPEVSTQWNLIETENSDLVAEVVELLHNEASEGAYAETDVLADANYQTEVPVEHTTDSENDGMLNDKEKVEEVSDMFSTPVMVDDGLWMRYVREANMPVIFSVVLALLVAFIWALGFHKSKMTGDSLPEEATSVAKQDAIRRQFNVRKVDNVASATYSKAGADTFNSGVGAPRVELLGEYTIGEKEVSSYSLRTGNFENYNDSTYSFSQRNMRISTSQPAVSGFSSTTETPTSGGQSSQKRSLKKEVPTSSIDSPSYGSFTTEMMFRKKEEARGGEKIIVTPVRRSSRIHSRTTSGAAQ